MFFKLFSMNVVGCTVDWGTVKSFLYNAILCATLRHGATFTVVAIILKYY